MCTLVFDTYRVAVPRLESCMHIFSLELEYRHISRAKVKCVVRDEEMGENGLSYVLTVLRKCLIDCDSWHHI